MFSNFFGTKLEFINFRNYKNKKLGT